MTGPTSADPVNGPPAWSFTLADTRQVPSLADWPPPFIEEMPAIARVWRRRDELLRRHKGRLFQLSCRCPHPIRSWTLAKVEEQGNGFMLGFFLFPNTHPTQQDEAVAQLLVTTDETGIGALAEAWVDALGNNELSPQNRRSISEAKHSLGSASEPPSRPRVAPSNAPSTKVDDDEPTKSSHKGLVVGGCVGCLVLLLCAGAAGLAFAWMQGGLAVFLG